MIRVNSEGDPGRGQAPSCTRTYIVFVLVLVFVLEKRERKLFFDYEYEHESRERGGQATDAFPKLITGSKEVPILTLAPTLAINQAFIVLTSIYRFSRNYVHSENVDETEYIYHLFR